MIKKYFAIVPLLCIAVILFVGCNKENDDKPITPTQGTVPILSTASVTNITQTTASSGGTITSDGGFPVTARGVCWSTTPSPMTLNSKTSDGAGVGSFVSNFTGLTANTVYYVRSYATNSAGTGYGDEMTFTTEKSWSGEVVKIGTQVWMLKNLDVTTYRNGDPIPQVADPTQWKNRTTGAWCYYENDPTFGAIYGKLYNWYAVNDPRGLAPAGWHVPTDAEWKTLEIYLGMSQSQADSADWRGSDEGGKLKESGTTHWISPNEGASNSNGFTALPGGGRIGGGNFIGINYHGYWWSRTEYGSSIAFFRSLTYDHADVVRWANDVYHGFSVRCVRD